MERHIRIYFISITFSFGFSLGIAQIQPPVNQTGQINPHVIMSAQESDCINFNNDTVTGVLGQSGGGTGTTTNPLGNWYQRCSGIQIANSYATTTSITSPDNSNFLIMYDRGCSDGSSFIWNSLDFEGNWTEKGECLCFNFNVIKNGNSGSTANANQIRIYNGSNPFPYDATNNTSGSTFVAYFSLTDMPQEGSGWTTICPPIGLTSADGTLPLNSQGQWVMSSGTNADWNSLITNVGGIAFLLDIGSSPTEVYGFDDFCFSECLVEENEVCCTQDLAIWNVAGTPDPIPTTQQTNPDATIAYEQFEIHQSSTIPITELRVTITDIIYNYNYESCRKCESNPALWASLLNPFNNDIGGLQFVPDSSGGNVQGNLIANQEGIRELVWRNPNGAMLTQGTTFPVWYMLPPASDIPCCVTSVSVCISVSWKDANCKMCEVSGCSHIVIGNEDDAPGKISIKKEEDCCGATLSVNASGNNIQWSNGETTPSIYISEAGTYSVTVAGQTETIVVTPDEVGSRYYTDILQSSNQSFYSSSGNNNSYNSFYIMHVEDPQPPYGEYFATDYRLEIWNRWGEMISVVEGTVETCQGFPNPAIFWDGTVNGNKVQTDVYNGKLFMKNCKYKNEWIPVKVNYCTQWGYTCLETHCKAGLSFECGFMKKNECSKWSSLMCKEEHKEFIFPITIV